MEYFISEKLLNIDIDVEETYEDDLLQFLEREFVFETDEFDEFFLVLQFTPKIKMGHFGNDRIQVSKKERALFLGVNLENEKFESDNYEHEYAYITSRVLEVKNECLSKLISNGLVVN